MTHLLRASTRHVQEYLRHRACIVQIFQQPVVAHPAHVGIAVVGARYVHYCLRDYREELEVLGRRDLKLDVARLHLRDVRLVR